MDGSTKDNSGPGRPTNGSAARGKRLRSWKEIAAFFGTAERTVKRWEATRGLPVQRVPGGARTAVFADVAELEQWIRGERSTEPTVDAPRPASAGRLRAILFGGVALLGLATGGYYLATRSDGGEAATAKHQPSQRALDLYTAGVNQSERATPESMRRAVALFGQAIADDPGFADAYAGLASAYIRMRIVASVSEAEAYPRARAAAQRALALDPNLSQAHAAMGYILFYADWDFERGLHHFREVSRLNPRSSSGRYQFGMALLHSGNAAEALRELEVAQRLDPRARNILADKGFVLYLVGRREEGIAMLRQEVADDPDFMLSHHYLTLIHLGEGDYRAGLDQAEIVARLRQDRDRLALAAPARQALDRGGGEAMLRTILAGQLRLHAAGREPSYVIAETYALLGERETALRYLRQSIAAREPLALTMRIDPLLRGLREDPEYRRLATQIGRPVRSPS